MDELTLEVTGMVAGGDGLARDGGGRVTFVRGALPGEQVRAELVDAHRDYAHATTLDVLRSSSDRTTPPCPFVAAGCGGCDWQHIAPAAQRELKASIVADALRRQARIEVDVAPGPELPSEGYRTTVRGVAIDGRFGFRHRGAHDVVPVAPCLVAHPLVDELITDGRFPDGEVILRAGARTGERLAIVEGPGAELPADVHVVTSEALRTGTRAWIHEEVAGRRWRIGARSFFQARPDGADALVAAVRDALGHQLVPGATLVDLYAGVGLFAGALTPAGRVTAVESSGSSVADARVNLAHRGARILKVDVDRWRPSKTDVVVADPPRTGLGRRAVANIAGSGAARLALVSCDPAALGRDAKLLAGAGYALRTATLVDLFPHTSHVEVVARFDRS